MYRITREHLVYSLDKKHPPVLKISPGAIVIFETHDARTGTIQTENDLLDHPPPLGMNPATGPVFVNGAEPGDSLLVEIKQVVLAEVGFLAVKAGVGLLAHRANRFVTKIIPIRDGIAHFSNRIRFPVRPMVGVIGTASSGEGISTGYPGPHGGNMDNNEVKAGAKIHLPVFVPGALLGIGDVHASMGDGEISMVGFETCAEVTVKIELLKGETITRPWIETADGRWVTTGDDLDPEQAMRIACEEMVNLLMKRWNLSFEEAYMLVTAYADLAICQACQPGEFPLTTRMSIPVLEVMR
ncbi:acetamidase [Candidatus Poribacteria bacterium]|nr:acetamidase [Candidatus Poribacteria bacterium]